MSKFRLKEYLFLGLLSLIPLLWFKPGFLITGTDVDAVLFPSERIEQRRFLWDPQILGGSDRSNNTASLPYFYIQSIIEKCGFNAIQIEKINYVFWFFLLCCSIYFLLSVLIDDNSDPSAMGRMAGTLLYSVNFYQAFMWVRLSINVCTLVLFPVFMGTLFGIEKKKFSRVTGALILAVTSVLCGSTGIQPPLVMILMISALCYGFFESIRYVRSHQYQYIWNCWKNILTQCAVFFLVSSFWLFPLLSFVLFSGYGNQSVGLETYSVHSLLEWVGSSTSFANVFRLLADVPWFDGWGGELYSPEFLPYRKNFMVVLATFAVPILSFSIFLKEKKLEKEVVFFGCLALLTLFLSKGIHWPFGFVYTFLIEYVPFFWIQRAPWQKFASMTILSYSVLSAYSIRHIFLKWKEKS